MNLEYKHKLEISEAKRRLDEYINKLGDIRFSGGFIVDDLKKSWTGNEMQLSLNLKKMVIDRRVKGTIRLKDNLVLMDFELPDIIRNFITNENLENIVRLNLDNILSQNNSL